MKACLSEVRSGDAQSLTEAIVSAANLCIQDHTGIPTRETRPKLTDPVAEPARRCASNKTERDLISKRLLQASKYQRRARRAIKTEQAIEKGRGRKYLQGLTDTQKLKQRIIKTTSTDGTIYTDPKLIAEVFANFYVSLYAASQT